MLRRKKVEHYFQNRKENTKWGNWIGRFDKDEVYIRCQDHDIEILIAIHNKIKKKRLYNTKKHKRICWNINVKNTQDQIHIRPIRLSKRPRPSFLTMDPSFHPSYTSYTSIIVLRAQVRTRTRTMAALGQRLYNDLKHQVFSIKLVELWTFFLSITSQFLFSVFYLDMVECLD